MVRTRKFITEFWYSQKAQDLIEYSLIIALIAVASYGIISLIFPSTQYIWTGANTSLSTAASAAS